MNKAALLKNTEYYVKNKMSEEGTGHDWFHVDRVRRTALKIAQQEKNVDLFIVQVASLLHDIGDWKLNISGKSEEEILRETCQLLSFPSELTEQVIDIILNMSYSKNVGNTHKLSPEGQIVQDADRLDAMGAIGIARAFAYGGKKGRELYNPAITPKTFQSTEEYQKANSPTINHFYEKIFLLRSQLNTKTAQKIALKRETFMKKYLEEFYKEWQGK
jgi:uncharacterized protein